MKLIVGLGNPGNEYNNTRHNIGFMCIDEVARYFKVSFDSNKFNGLYTQFNYNGEKIILLKPQKYMNLSGEVIRDFVNFFKIDMFLDSNHILFPFFKVCILSLIDYFL